MPIIDKLAKGALSAVRAAKTAEQVDPLVALVAARMSGQLEAMSPLMGLQRSANLPAAYAGDQRSMQAVQRQLHAADNGGLESPGRRKILKQGAATAARSAVPDTVMDALGTGVIKKALTDTVQPQAIPDASIQAAIAAQMDKFLGKHGYLLSDLNDQNYSLNLLRMDLGPNPTLARVKQYIKDEELGDTVGAKDLQSILRDWDLHLDSPAIEAAYALPADTVTNFAKKSKFRPKDLVDEWAGSRAITDEAQYGDMGTLPGDFEVGDVTLGLESHPEFKSHLRAARRAYEANDEDAMLNSMDEMRRSISSRHLENQMQGYNSLLGEHLGPLVEKHGELLGNPAEMAARRVEIMSDSDAFGGFLSNYVSGAN